MSAFDIKRTGRFLRYEILSRRQDLLLPLVVPPALFAVTILFAFLMGRPEMEWPKGVFILALIFGAGSAAYAHRRKLQSETASIDLMLPVSHSERFVSRLISSFCLPFFGQLLMLTLLAAIASFLRLLFGHGWPGFLLPETQLIVNSFSVFMFWHCVFFAGGTFFRGSPIIKTALASFALFSLVMIIFGGAIISKIAVIASSGFTTELVTQDWSGGPMQIYLILAWTIIFPLLLYTAAFFRTIENEDRG